MFLYDSFPYNSFNQPLSLVNLKFHCTALLFQEHILICITYACMWTLHIFYILQVSAYPYLKRNNCHFLIYWGYSPSNISCSKSTKWLFIQGLMSAVYFKPLVLNYIQMACPIPHEIAFFTQISHSDHQQSLKYFPYLLMLAFKNLLNVPLFFSLLPRSLNLPLCLPDIVPSRGFYAFRMILLLVVFFLLFWMR